MTALVLTYHLVGSGGGPLVVDRALFREQLDRIVDSGASAVTVSELAGAVRAGRVPGRTLALTFDDGAAALVTEVAPLLVERRLRATVFCVAGHLGGWNDWPGRHAARFRLASAAELAELSGTGFEIGAHGLRHLPLRGVPPELARREVVDAKEALEQAIGVPVRSFAYPYGAVGAETLVRETYAAACTTRLDVVGRDADPHALPRVDVHYLRRAALFRRALAGSLGPYLAARRLGARARRALREDYAG